ncbi:hypothetical protein SAMCFNEI73_pB0029 (plasmid) [Sinorhizobium americanum]|uniref:Uncharacterized protein n=1 Tax=Sinorhizobium americanum TaxID=194963 RepID=A0A1L3LT12_9HYPH|nr:hypothetical protein SAMCFNEI73_pB0029 [Sinorhizobium americanum]
MASVEQIPIEVRRVLDSHANWKLRQTDTDHRVSRILPHDFQRFVG